MDDGHLTIIGLRSDHNLQRIMADNEGKLYRLYEYREESRAVEPHALAFTDQPRLAGTELQANLTETRVNTRELLNQPQTVKAFNYVLRSITIKQFLRPA